MYLRCLSMNTYKILYAHLKFTKTNQLLPTKDKTEILKPKPKSSNNYKNQVEGKF